MSELPVNAVLHQGQCLLSDFEAGYTMPVHQYPSFPITESEIFALLIADKAIAQYHCVPRHQPLEAAFRKLTGQLDTDDVDE